MSGPVDDRLREFTSRLLQRHGADVDWPAGAEQGLALLPRNVAETLRCLEILPLAVESSSPLPINLSSDFLDRVEPLVQAEPQVVSLQIPTAYLKRSDMAEPVARAFTWLNARVRVQNAEPTRTEYHMWYFLATLDSADRWQQVVRVSVNASSGAQTALPDMLDVDAGLAEPADLPADYPSTQLAAVRAALGRIETESRAFVERLEGRRGRDRKRLQDYYGALLRGDGKRSGRRGADEDAARQEANANAVQLELRRKLAELDERYACRVDLTPRALVRIDCPALAVQCRVLRRSAARMYTVYWNPLSKELEPLRCSHCGISTFSVAFSDDKVAALCAPCHG
ncbi:MAG: hypothetical protein V2A79_13580 [Planctomycetota bacterium]